MNLPQRVRIGIKAKPPPQRGVYSNLNYEIQSKANGSREMLSISSVLSGIVSIFDWDLLDMRYLTLVSGEGQQMPGADPAATNLVLYLSMGSVMHCAKPITLDNSKYVENRWSALTATLESTGSSIPTITVDANALISIASKCRPYIRPDGVVNHLMAGDSDFAELYNQIKMVYSYSGMKLADEMRHFSLKPYTCAILLSTVMEQAKNYLVKYNTIKSANPEKFEFARVVLKNEIEPLDAANFPDLYWASYYSMRRKVSSNFKTSSHDPQTPRDMIKRFAKVHLTDFGALSDENKRILKSLSVNLETAKKKVEKLSKHKRIHLSNKSDSDSDSDLEPARKRRRNWLFCSIVVNVLKKKKKKKNCSIVSALSLELKKIPYILWSSSLMT